MKYHLGGGWMSRASILRAWYRDWDDPSLRDNSFGFRLVRRR